MSIDDRMRIDGVQPPNEPRNDNPAGSTDPTQFRRLLEKLEDVARNSNKEEVQDLSELREVMKKADDEFSAVMDLRRQLEEAYRKSQQ